MTSTDQIVSDLRDYFLGRTPHPACWSPEVVVETPFAPPGHPRRIVGLDQFLAATAATRAALPVRFDEMREVVVHDAGGTLVLEYVLAGTVLPSGTPASAPFVAVLHLADGQVIRWREYQDTDAIAAALAAG